MLAMMVMMTVVMAVRKMTVLMGVGLRIHFSLLI